MDSSMITNWDGQLCAAAYVQRVTNGTRSASRVPLGPISFAQTYISLDERDSDGLTWSLMSQVCESRPLLSATLNLSPTADIGVRAITRQR
jgi:hypothetical protein